MMQLVLGSTTGAKKNVMYIHQQCLTSVDRRGSEIGENKKKFYPSLYRAYLDCLLYKKSIQRGAKTKKNKKKHNKEIKINRTERCTRQADRIVRKKKRRGRCAWKAGLRCIHHPVGFDYKRSLSKWNPRSHSAHVVLQRSGCNRLSCHCNLTN